MNKKKIGLIVVVLFLLIGLGSFVFANPNEEENLKKKGKDIEETETIKDKDSGEDETTDEEDADSSQGVITVGDTNRTVNNNRNNNANPGGNGNSDGTGNVVVTDNGYNEALKAVEKAESSFTQDDVDRAEELVNKVTDQQGKEELQERLDAVQAAIDAEKLVAELENKVENSKNITDINDARDYRAGEEVEKVVSELKDSTLKEKLEERLEAILEILDDNDRPVITGIDNNSFTKENVTLTIEDANDVTTTVTLDGKEIDFQGEFTEEGTYVVTVVDEAFNEATLTFTIDKTKPVVGGVEDGKYYNTDVAVTIDDANPGTIHLKKDGVTVKPYKPGDILTEEGTYTVYVSDKAGNKSKTITFVIDKHVEDAKWVYILNLSDKNNRKTIRDGQTLRVEVNFDEKLTKLPVLTIGNSQSTEFRKCSETDYGKYVCVADLTIDNTIANLEDGEIPFTITNIYDKAGNTITLDNDNVTETKEYGQLTYDGTAPVIKSLGITDINEFTDEVGKLYAKYGDTVRVLVKFDEKLGTEPTVKLGGKEFTATYREDSPKYSYYADIKLTEDMNLKDGILPFEVYGYADEIGNVGVNLTEKDVNNTTYPSVTIDNTLPELNFHNGFITSGYTVEVTDDNFAYMTVQYYDGREMQTIESNTFTLDKEGDNTRYNIKAYDKAGNVSEYRDIYLDNATPVISGTAKNAGEDVSIKNNGIYQEVALNISDGSLKKVSLVKEDGSEEELATYKDNYTNKKITFEKKYTEEGTYTIKAVDRNKNESTITFTIDKTPASRVYSTLDFDKSGKQYYENDGEKVYYVKNGDSFTFRMQFSEALKTAPTVKVGGMVVPMTLNEKFLNNEGKYIYEGTVNITQEAKLTQGRLEIVLSNVIDLAGNESTDEVVLNQTPTSNGRVVVYDVTSPGPTILGITGFFNENEDAHYITYGKKVRVLTYYKEKLSVNPVVKIGNKEFETYYTEDSSDLKNGVYAYYADIAITEDLGLNEGEITFTVSGHKDLAGNEGRAYTNKDITYNENQEYKNRYDKVILDNTMPKVSIGGSTGSKNWHKEQNIEVKVTEANIDNIYYAFNASSNDGSMHKILDSEKAIKVDKKDIIDNGDGTYTTKIHLATEGRYVLNIKVVDKAGNTTYTRRGWYQIDRTDPTIVLHKDKNPEEIKPGVHNYCVSATISDKNLKSTKLNGKDYKSDDFICDDGNHTLVATDKAGNSKTIEFKIDRTYPVITINGVNYTGDTNDAGFFNNIDLKLTEANNYTAWVNDKEVDLTTYDFNKDGNYKVKVVDEASNNTTVNFTVDTVLVTKVELRVNSSNQNNQYAKTGDSFGIYLTVNEELKENPTFTVNGKEYKVNQTETVQSGYKYAVVYTVTKDMDEGEMQFTISNIYDKAGNPLADLSNKDTEQKIVIDNTAPTATITYNTVNPTNRAVIATLNASEEVKILNAGTWNPNSGYATTFEKSYPENKTQTVTIEDKAGNQSTVEVVINNIDKDAPELVIDTIVNGVSNSQNPQVHATDINGFKISVKLNEEEVRNDTASLNANGIYSSWFGIGYMKDGSYEITATDNLGNSKTIAFELKRSE